MKLEQKSKKLTNQSIILGRDIAFNRKALENKNTNVLILNHSFGKDKLKQRDSGLNQVLCKIARDNKITLAIDLNELIQEKDKRQKAIILGRIIQNIKLIKKYKNRFKLLNCKNKSQSFSLLLTLGLPTNMIKEAINENSTKS